MSNPNICGPFSQTLFLGASITSFSSSLGWNGDQGTLDVELVEDSCRGTKIFYDAYLNAQITNQADFFNPPTVGSPVYFRFGDFSFGGILQSWEQTKDTQGGKTYSVKCTDPVEIIEGCQVIINNYTGGTFGVPNLINAFGYNETLNAACNTLAYTGTLNPPLGYTPALGFGGSNVNDDGMSWFQVKNAISVLSANPSPTYGGNIQLRNTSYFIDISELPILDANFRLNGDSLNVMEAVSQVCAAAGMDYFVELIYATPGSVPTGYGGITGLIHPSVWKFIKIRTASRYNQRTGAYNVDLTVGSPIDNRLNFGRISAFIGNGDGKNRISRGLELRNDITNAFVIGDNRQDLWQQPYSGDQDTYTDTIWPYWGVDNIGFPIISEGVDNEHNFTVSTEGWDDTLVAAIGPTYNITLLEIRAALSGSEEWALFMQQNKNPTAVALKMDAAFVLQFIQGAAAANLPPVPNDMKKTDREAIKNAWRAAAGAVHGIDNVEKDFGEIQQKLFEIVKSYGNFFGKKFMVALPIVCAKSDDSEPFAVKLNWQKSDGAWTDGNVHINPLTDALVPTSPILERFRGDDGRIECFVYFNTEDDDLKINYTKLSPDDVVPLSETECYVKATVEAITFLNPLALTYPRALINLSSEITIKGKDAEADAPVVNAFLAALNPVAPPDGWTVKQWGRFGDDTNKLALHPLPLMPIGAAVPLKSTNLCYGPWMTTLSFGPAAKTNYERDPSLSPWGFGGTSIMNYAGQIKVETQVTQQIVNESGSLTVPGAPTRRLGDVLISGGPEITNIDTQVGIGGVTSSLRFRTWVPNFGELGRRRINSLRLAGTYQQKLQRAFIKNSFAPNNKVVVGNWIRELAKTDRFNRHSSHTIIAAELVDDYEASYGAGYKRPNVVMTDLRKVVPEAYHDYEKKAFMDLSGLFRPFETSEVTGHDLPFFNQVTPTAGTITDQSLNPFKTSEVYNGTSVGHDIEYLARGNSIDDIEDMSIKKEGAYGSGPFRGVGFKGPMVIVGWGFDINGKPVPNSNPAEPTDYFATNYLRKPHTWKAGPLDVRWDEDRGVWSAAGGTAIIKARLTSTLTFRSAAYANIYKYNSTESEEQQEGDTIIVRDWILPSGGFISANTNIFISAEQGGDPNRYYLINASCATSVI